MPIPTIKIVLINLFCFGFLANLSAQTAEAQLLHELNAQLTETIITDGFNPPAASRIYAYANLAAYECLAPYSRAHQSLGKKVNGFNGFSGIDPNTHHRELLLIHVFVGVAKELVYRPHILDYFKQGWVEAMQHVSPQMREATLAKANELVESFLAYMKADNYLTLKESKRYVSFRGPQFWEPTPPAYLDALEPNWNLLRPWVLKEASEVSVDPPLTFDTIPGSAFRKEVEETMNTVKELTHTQQDIAKFWDCNPLQTQVMGHMTFVSRQLNPAGHWVGIAAIACKKKELGLVESAETYALATLAMADAFIVVWNEKYRSSLIRPETYINRYIDPKWRPVLETPPFPEHPSGHAGISAAAATVLTHLLGDNIPYEDDTEVNFGLTVRSFNSFREAANEAAISRIYGGIHYNRAASAGVKLGNEVGSLVLQRAKTRP